jgi:hypothetical protein
MPPTCGCLQTHLQGGWWHAGRVSEVVGVALSCRGVGMSVGMSVQRFLHVHRQESCTTSLLCSGRWVQIYTCCCCCSVQQGHGCMLHVGGHRVLVCLHRCSCCCNTIWQVQSWGLRVLVGVECRMALRARAHAEFSTYGLCPLLCEDYVSSARHTD